MEQRRMLARETRQEVESVCANASLSVAQKRQRIREIHQQERQRMEGLITPQQQAAMRACQQERGGGAHLGGGHRGLGPCGTMPGLADRENESNEESPQK
jgi:Spy/CpxP family protein refolding chaperone